MLLGIGIQLHPSDPCAEAQTQGPVEAEAVCSPELCGRALLQLAEGRQQRLAAALAVGGSSSLCGPLAFLLWLCSFSFHF